MKTSKSLLNSLLFVFMIIFLASCFEREDPGPLQEQEREYYVEDFNRLEVGDAFDVRVEQGSEFSIQVRGDRRNIDDLEVRKVGNTLRVRYDDSDNRQHTSYLTITMPSLEGATFSGAVTAKVSGFESDGELDIDLSGASYLNISGKTAVLDATASGASSLNAFDLETQTAKVDASGASTIKVSVSQHLTAKASGASDIRYRGAPTVNQSSSGASSIRED